MNINNKNSLSRPKRKRRSKTKPDIVHPTVPGAVGSHESPYQEGRDSLSDSRLIIDDTIKNIRGQST
jgi:hypothetical protein